MEDSLDAYISSALIDGAVNASDEAGATTALGNELFMQLLLNAVDGTAQGAVDPSSLTNAGSMVSEDDTAETNALLEAALLSSDIAALGRAPEMQGEDDSAMLIDAPLVAGGDIKPEATLSPPANAATQAPARAPRALPPRQGSVAAGRRSMPVSPAAGQRPARPAAPPPTARVGPTAALRVPQTAPGPSSMIKQRGGSPMDDKHEDEDDGLDAIDLKSLTSKERRQLRNKISARNFRVRRKEYISNLEAEAHMHKEEADGLRRELAASRKDNAQLREEVQRLKMRLGALSTSQPAGSTVSVARPAAARPAAPARPQRQQQQQRLPASQARLPPASQPRLGKQVPVPAVAAPATTTPLVRFNPHKDIPQKPATGSAPGDSDGSWAAKNSRSGFITVNYAMLPAAHGATAGELLAEARRKQTVDALLGTGGGPGPGAGDPSAAAVATALLSAASLIAELVLPQIALESSLALLHAPPAMLPTLPVAC